MKKNPVVTRKEGKRTRSEAGMKRSLARLRRFMTKMRISRKIGARRRVRSTVMMVLSYHAKCATRRIRSQHRAARPRAAKGTQESISSPRRIRDRRPCDPPTNPERPRGTVSDRSGSLAGTSGSSENGLTPFASRSSLGATGRPRPVLASRGWHVLVADDQWHPDPPFHGSRTSDRPLITVRRTWGACPACVESASQAIPA